MSSREHASKVWVSTLSAHRARLRATFRQALLLLVASPTALSGCGDNGTTNAGDGSVDGPRTVPDATGDDGSSQMDASADSFVGSDATGSDAIAPDASVDGLAGDGLAGDAGVDGSLADAASDAGAPDAGDSGPTFQTCSDASAGAPYYVGDAGCMYFVNLSCPLYPTDPGTCYLLDCSAVCNVAGTANFGCQYLGSCQSAGWDDGGPVTIMCDTCLGVGRRPAGLCRTRRPRATNVLGDYFARASHLEAASVRAFERLQRELMAHGAPQELRDAAARSACDERRHARVTARIARRFGGQPPKVRMKPSAARSLERIAVENVVEGCVRETAGALIATWQASKASDPEVRRCMKSIAADETRHAALAWAVAGWLETRLSSRAIERVARARRAAVARLESELPLALPVDLVVVAGLPSARDARALLATLSTRLWI
jgi:hypothetical protein